MNPVLVRFTLLAPFVAQITLQTVEAIAEAVKANTSVGNAVLVGAMKGFLGLFLGYPFGLIPAIVASAIYWGILKGSSENRNSVAKRVIVGTIAGLCCSMAYGALLTGDVRWMPLMPFAIAGGVAGAVCALVVGASSFQAAIPREAN